MDYFDLKREDGEDAFIGWEPVTVAKEVGDIPEKFHPYFADQCDCGSENIIKMNLSTVTCCDPKCPIKIGFAIAEMFTRFGVKGLQEASCRKIYRELQGENERRKRDGETPIFLADSYVSVLGVKWDDYPASVQGIAKGWEFFAACCQIIQKKLTFPKMVSMLAIPTLGAEAEELLAGISDVNQMFSLIEEAGNVRSFCESRGFHSAMTAFYFRQSLIDITTANIIFSHTLRPEGSIRINVCMTGAISFQGNRTTKEKYLQKCNELCFDGSIQLLEIKMNAAIETNPFILYSNPSSDRKFIAGKARGIVTDVFGTHPVLMHVDTFYSFLERVMQKWKEATKKNQQECFLRAMKTNLSEALRGVLSEKD